MGKFELNFFMIEIYFCASYIIRWKKKLCDKKLHTKFWLLQYYVDVEKFFGSAELCYLQFIFNEITNTSVSVVSFFKVVAVTETTIHDSYI